MTCANIVGQGRRVNSDPDKMNGFEKLINNRSLGNARSTKTLMTLVACGSDRNEMVKRTRAD